MWWKRALFIFPWILSSQHKQWHTKYLTTNARIADGKSTFFFVLFFWYFLSASSPMPDFTFHCVSPFSASQFSFRSFYRSVYVLCSNGYREKYSIHAQGTSHIMARCPTLSMPLFISLCAVKDKLACVCLCCHPHSPISFARFNSIFSNLESLQLFLDVVVVVEFDAKIISGATELNIETLGWH